jgi:translation initiation factor IF-2
VAVTAGAIVGVLVLNGVLSVLLTLNEERKQHILGNFRRWPDRHRPVAQIFAARGFLFLILRAFRRFISAKE